MNSNLEIAYDFHNDKHNSKSRKNPNNIAAMNAVNIRFKIILNREENHLCIHDSHLEFEFNVIDDAGGIFGKNFGNDAI